MWTIGSLLPFCWSGQLFIFMILEGPGLHTAHSLAHSMVGIWQSELGGSESGQSRQQQDTRTCGPAADDCNIIVIRPLTASHHIPSLMNNIMTTYQLYCLKLHIVAVTDQSLRITLWSASSLLQA